MALCIERVKGAGAVVRITVDEARLAFFEILAAEPTGPQANMKQTAEGRCDFVLQKVLQEAVQQMNDAVQAHQVKDADVDKQAEAQKAEIDKRAAKLKGCRPELVGFDVV